MMSGNMKSPNDSSSLNPADAHVNFRFAAIVTVVSCHVTFIR